MGRMDYIRRRYKVKIKAGDPVRWAGRIGTVIGARAGYLRVKFQGESVCKLIHPKDDNLIYLLEV